MLKNRAQRRVQLWHRGIWIELDSRQYGVDQRTCISGSKSVGACVSQPDATNLRRNDSYIDERRRDYMLLIILLIILIFGFGYGGYRGGPGWGYYGGGGVSLILTIVLILLLLRVI
jgi:hypothetical protein